MSGQPSRALGRLWCAGVPADLSRLEAGEGRRRVPLPTYPFEPQRFWIDPPADFPAERKKETPMAEPVPRREAILEVLGTIVRELTGIEEEEADPNVHFIEVGVDSLMLIQAAQLIEDQLGVRNSIIQLLEELTTLGLVADYLDRELPTEDLPGPLAAVLARRAPAPSPEAEPASASAGPDPEAAAWPAASPGPMPAPPTAAEAPAGVDRSSSRFSTSRLSCSANWSRWCALGLALEPRPLLRRPAPSRLPLPRLRPRLPRHERRSRARRLGPGSQPPRRSGSASSRTSTCPTSPPTAGGGSTPPEQSRALDELVQRYNAKTRRSKEHVQRYRPVLADGRMSARFRRTYKELIYPIVGERSAGSRVWDLDGNEYVDFGMGFGLHLFGHSPDFLRRAIEERLAAGVELGPHSNLAGEVAERITQLTGFDRATFCNSGTEAVMVTLRMARTFTRRRKIALFAGGYHGWSDLTQARAIVRDGKRTFVPWPPV